MCLDYTTVQVFLIKWSASVNSVFVQWFSAGGHWNASLCIETLICWCCPCLLSTSDLLTASLLFLAADYQLLNTEVSLNAPHMEFHNSSCLPNQHRSIRKWHKHKHTLSTKKENRHEPNCKYFHAECGVFNMRRVFVQSLNTTVIYVCFQCSLSISKKTSCLGGKRRVHRSLVRTQITFYFK